MEEYVDYFKDWFEKYQPEGTIFEQFLWGIWGVWVLMILVATLRVLRFRFGLVREKKIWGDGSGSQRPAVIIVPIKGISPGHTPAFFQSLLDQNYSSYRIIVTVETVNDPAAEWLIDQFDISMTHPVWVAPQDSGGLREVRLVVAGEARDQGQKVQNQLAAFEHLVPEDEIIAFVDADIVCPPDWLARLTAPINRKTHDPASTYRWLVPRRRRLASLFASVINASVTTQGGNVRENMTWGGSMAISREAFQDLDVPRLFSGSLNDDLRLGKAAKRAGYRVAFIRNLVRPTEIDFGWGGFIEFARRQYLQVKFFAPILYSLGNFICLIYIAGFYSVVYFIATGYLFAWVPLIAVTFLDQWRAMLRESIYRRLFGHDKQTYRKIARTAWIEHFLTPVWMTLHGFIIFSTWFMSKVTWGGIRYKVKGVSKTRVLSRRPTAPGKEKLAIGDLAIPAGGMVAALDTGIAGVESNFAPPAMEYEAAAPVVEEVPVAEAETPVPVKKAVTPTEPINVAALSEELEAETVVEDALAEEETPFLPEGACEFVVTDLAFEAEESEETGEPGLESFVPEGACEFTVFSYLEELDQSGEPALAPAPAAVDSGPAGPAAPDPLLPVMSGSENGAVSAVRHLGWQGNHAWHSRIDAVPRVDRPLEYRHRQRKRDLSRLIWNPLALSQQRLQQLDRESTRRVLRRLR